MLARGWLWRVMSKGRRKKVRVEKI